MNPQQYIAARRDQNQVVLEGVHALKHAIRFEAEIIDAITPDKLKLLELCNRLAPKERNKVEKLVREVPESDYLASSSVAIRSGVIAIAKRKTYSEDVIADTTKPVVWLDNPKDHENVGAIIRLSAGLGAGAVVVTGTMDVWNPGVLRGAAGLNFALPVVKTEELPTAFNKSVYVFDDSGKTFRDLSIPKSSIIVFGSERFGVGEQIKAEAAAVVGIPMKEGVSSFNLATSVAIGLSHIVFNP